MTCILSWWNIWVWCTLLSLQPLWRHCNLLCNTELVFTRGFFTLFLKMLILQTQRALNSNTKYIKIMVLFTTFSHEFLNKIEMHLFSKGHKGVPIILCLLSCNSKHQMLHRSSIADYAKPLSHYFWYTICLRKFSCHRLNRSFRMCELWGHRLVHGIPNSFSDIIYVASMVINYFIGCQHLKIGRFCIKHLDFQTLWKIGDVWQYLS